MAQMEFYFSDNEIEELFWYIHSKGGYFIPDLLYSSDKYIVVLSYEEFLKYQQTETVHFFLKDNKYSVEPLVLTPNRFMDEPKYSINQRKGGPYIDFSFYRGYAKDATIQYRRSDISIYPKFIHSDSYEEFKATPELKEYYDDIVKYIKNKSKQIKKNNKRYWLGREALRDLAEQISFGPELPF